MGMFDYLRCAYPLPRDGANALEFQTKDTEAQLMDWYELRADGTLWHLAYDQRIEKTENAPLGFYVHRENQRWEQEMLTGEITFSAWPHGECVLFSAYFVRGQLRHLEDLTR